MTKQGGLASANSPYELGRQAAAVCGLFGPAAPGTGSETSIISSRVFNRPTPAPRADRRRLQPCAGGRDDGGHKCHGWSTSGACIPPKALRAEGPIEYDGKSAEKKFSADVEFAFPRSSSGGPTRQEVMMTWLIVAHLPVKHDGYQLI